MLCQISPQLARVKRGYFLCLKHRNSVFSTISFIIRHCFFRMWFLRSKNHWVFMCEFVCMYGSVISACNSYTGLPLVKKWLYRLLDPFRLSTRSFYTKFQSWPDFCVLGCYLLICLKIWGHIRHFIYHHHLFTSRGIMCPDYWEGS